MPYPTHQKRSADEREYDAFMLEQDPLDIEAATWVARKRSGLDHEEHAALHAWLNEDVRHQQAFNDIDNMLGAIRQLPGDLVGRIAARYGNTPHGVESFHPAGRAERSWRLDLAGRVRPARVLAWKLFTGALITAMIAVGVMSWNTWYQRPIFTETYVTQRGQLLNAMLPDTPNRSGARGTSLHFDTSTHARARCTVTGAKYTC